MKELSERRTISELSKVFADNPWYSTDPVVKSLPSTVDGTPVAFPEDVRTRYKIAIYCWCKEGFLNPYRHNEQNPTSLTGVDYSKFLDDDLEIALADLKAFLRAQGLPLPDDLFPNEPDNTTKRRKEEMEFVRFERVCEGLEPLLDELNEKDRIENDLRALETGPCIDEASRQITRDLREQKLQEVNRKIELLNKRQAIKDDELHLLPGKERVESVDIQQPKKAEAPSRETENPSGDTATRVISKKEVEEHTEPLRRNQNDRLRVIKYAQRLVNENPKITPTELSRKVKTYLESTPDWLHRRYGTRTYENWVRRCCDGYAEGQRGRKKKAE